MDCYNLLYKGDTAGQYTGQSSAVKTRRVISTDLIKTGVGSLFLVSLGKNSIIAVQHIVYQMV